MKPIVLYEENESTFTSNGLGTLDEAISAEITEELNGTYEMTFTYPVTGLKFSEIKHSRIVKAVASPGGDYQLFRIYGISKAINGIITVNAEHISYQLSYIVVNPFTATSAADAMAKLSINATSDCPFEFWTDKQTVANYNQETPDNIRARLAGVSGSILDVYGGEYEFDNYTVKLHNHRGQNRNVTLRYGKNITDIEQEENIASTYTSIVGFWKGEDEVVKTAVIDSQYASAYPFKRVKVVDFSQEYETAPTVVQLTARATAYMNSNNFGIPNVSIKVSFVALWQTEEYKDIAVLERVYLGDTVSVYYEKLGITASAKVVRMRYNVLLDRYDSIELGKLRSNLSNKLAQQDIEIKEQITDARSALERVVEHATELIRGGLGGHVVLNTDADGKPQEILVMDTDDIHTATKVWRWNLGGLGYSKTGYDGNYGTAITMDGTIVADFITAGTMQANRIRAGLLQDETETNYWNLTTGELRISSNTKIGSGNDTFQSVIDGIQDQIDGNITSWFYDYQPTLSNAPASTWTTVNDRIAHVGDLFYNSDTGYCYRWQVNPNAADPAHPTLNDFEWVRISDEDISEAMRMASAAQDTADGKRRVFVSTPVPPYDVGDLWAQGATGDLLKCATPKTSTESYHASDWVKASKYTDDTALTNFISNTYGTDKTNLQNQIDKKAETWYQAADPSTAWTTDVEKAKHVGDLWYKTTDDTTWYYDYSNNTYSWKQQNIPTEVFDEIDGKAQIFTTQPVPPYSVGDLWCEGASGDILTCTTAKGSGQSYSASDWTKLNKYTDNSALTSFINTTYATDKEAMIGLIDSKAETWYQSTDPATAWTTTELKDAHVGDLWYNTTNDTTWYYQKSGSTYSWQQQNIPQAVFDKIDGKAQIFITQPVPPYNVGDLWCEGASGDILSCVTAKTAGQSYAAADWEKKNKYTDNSALTAFITTTYATDKVNLESQIDKKAETWYQNTDPALDWTTADEKAEHVGDLWYNTTNGTTWYYDFSNNTYSWKQQNVPQAVFDEIDGKARIFITQPVPPYDVGDLWCKGTSGGIYNCVTAKASGQSYSADDWAIKNNYIDSAEVTSQINAYDTSLNQSAVFNKLTNNGTAQGIFLQNGNLYINGAYIQANTISANALTAQAKNDLQPLHNYLPFDIFENISRWEINAKTVSYTTITVDGQQKTALVLDGTDISSYTASYQTQVKSSLIGNPKVNISFKYQTDRDVTPALQQFVYIYYRNTDASNTYYERGWNIGGALIPANTEQSFSISADPITGYSNRSISPIYSPKFGFRFFPNCKTYIYDIEVTSVNEDYTNAKLEFTVDGLDSTVQKGSLISNINQSAEAVTINANKINLTGALSLQGDFHCYQDNNNANYAYLNNGQLSFFNNGDNVFTISARGAYGDYAGIYFGEFGMSASGNKTRITAGEIRSTGVYIGDNGNERAINELLVQKPATFDDAAQFHDNVYFGGGDVEFVSNPTFDSGLTCNADLVINGRLEVNNTSFISEIYGTTRFYGQVENENGGAVFVSDRRKKRNIKDLVIEKAKSFIMALKPVKYKFIKEISKSDRYHHGFIAQDVRQAMPEDWGLYCENKDNDFIGLRYDELIADMVAVIQDQEKRIEALEMKVQEQGKELAALKEKESTE